MNEKKNLTIIGLFMLLMLVGYGKNNDTYLENIPDPYKCFSQSDFSEYSNDKFKMKGVTIYYSGSDIESDYNKYIDKCKSSNIWINKIFVSDDSWCYQNKDGTLQLAINLYKDNNMIDICIKEIKESD